MNEEMKNFSDRGLYFGYNSNKIVTDLYENEQVAQLAVAVYGITTIRIEDFEVLEFIRKAKDCGETVFVMESLCCLCTFPITSPNNIVFYRKYDKYEEGNTTSLLNIAANTIAEDFKKLAANSEIPIITAKQNPEETKTFWAIYNIHSGEIVSVEDEYPKISNLHYIKTESMMYSRNDYALINFDSYLSRDKIIERVYDGIISVSVDDEDNHKIAITPDGKHASEKPDRPRTRFLLINKKTKKVAASFGTIPQFSGNIIRTTLGDYGKELYKCIKVTETGSDDYITENIKKGNIDPDMFVDISGSIFKRKRKGPWDR